MDAQDRVYLAVRTMSGKHRTFIRNTVPSHEPKDYEQLITRIFSHQPAAYMRRDYNPGDPHTMLDEEVLANHFYQNCYSIPILGRDMHGARIQLSDFIDELLTRYATTSRNRISYLVGDVGVGKTTFVNYLISKFGPDWVESGKHWFVRVDVEINGEGHCIDRHELLAQLSGKIISVLQRNEGIWRDHAAIGEALRELIATSKQDSSFQDTATRIVRLVKLVRDLAGRRLLVIFDNIDYLCHTRDRYLFEDSGTGEHSILFGICEMVQMFYHDSLGDVGRLGADLLFVTRRDSYQVLTRNGETSLPATDINQNVHLYHIDSPPWEEVLRSRAKLLSFAAEHLPKAGLRRDYSRLAEVIEQQLAYAPPSQPKLIVHLQELANSGLRQIVEFFAQYSWISADEYTSHMPAIERFVHRYPVGLLTFMLGGRLLFSQFESRFPNIYLVCMQPRKGDDSREHEHPHSYWLKRLIVELLALRSSNNENTLPTDFMDVFCCQGNGGYPERLVKECLGSLSDVNRSNLIRVSRSRPNGGRDLQIDSIELNARGQHCIKHVFDKFFYLQLIVDDYMLPLPNDARSVFGFGANPLDYGYVVLTGQDYSEGARAMIIKKAKQVLLFLDILEYSLEFEKQVYSRAFGNLKEIGASIPNVSAVRAQVKNELNRIFRTQGIISPMNWIERDLDSIRDNVKAQLERMYLRRQPPK